MSQSYLGRHPTVTHNYYFDGQMDEVRIWNVARTKEQIEENYNKVINSGQGLVAYYDFNGGVANADNSNETTLKNKVSVLDANSDGTLMNFELQGIVSNYRKSAIPVISEK